MKAFFASALLIAANAVTVSQHNPYYKLNTHNYNFGIIGNLIPKANSVITEVEPVFQRDYIPQIVPVCPKTCAKATILDAWEGHLADGQFGTHGEMTFEQNCNGKTTIRGSFKNLRVTSSINGISAAQTTQEIAPPTNERL